MGRGRVGAGSEGFGSARISSAASGSAQRPSHQAGQVHGSRRGPRFSPSESFWWTSGQERQSPLGAARPLGRSSMGCCARRGGRMPRIPSCWRETCRALCSWLLVLAICPLGCLLGKSFGWVFFFAFCR